MEVVIVKVCSSCNKEVTNDFVEFECPGCSKKRIVRCEKCRALSKEYKCSCGFVGP
ncbi:MAG: zinc finger domain-containing protein [archaeon]